MPMRLAILDADILRPTLRPRYHSYGRMFVDLFQRAGVPWSLDCYSVIEGSYPYNPNEYDGFLITGSQYDAFSDAEWVVRLRAYVRSLYHEGKPLIGVCFGHQLLAEALGGKVERADAGWGLGVMSCQLESLPEFVDSSEPVSLLVSHRDQVTRLPENATLLLSNEFCPISGFYIPNHLLAVQGHPEFSVDYARALLDARAEQLDPQVVVQAKESMATPPEGLRLVRWIEGFLLGVVEGKREKGKDNKAVGCR